MPGFEALGRLALGEGAEPEGAGPSEPTTNDIFLYEVQAFADPNDIKLLIVTSAQGEVEPEPEPQPEQPDAGGVITAGYFSRKKWHDLLALMEAERAAQLRAEELKRSVARDTLRAATRVTAEITEGIHAGEGMPVIEPLTAALEAAAAADRLSDVLSKAKHALRLANRIRAEMDEEEEAIALMLLS